MFNCRIFKFFLFILSIEIFQGRHTKLMIVLLQRSTNQTDDAIAGERLSTLATKCDINQKMIFIFPYNDNLMGIENFDISNIRVCNFEKCFDILLKRFHATLRVSIFGTGTILLFAIFKTSSYAS